MGNRNKVFISIVVLLVLSLSVFAFIKYNWSDNDVNENGQSSDLSEWKCWDNVCDEYETQNPGICPEDCKREDSEQSSDTIRTLSTPSEVIDFNKLATEQDFGNFLKIQKLAIDSKRRKLYVPWAEWNIAIIDMDKNELVDSFDLDENVWGVVIDEEDFVYTFNIEGKLSCSKLDIENKKILESVDFSICECLMDSNKCKDSDNQKEYSPGINSWGKYSFRSIAEAVGGNFTTGSTPELNGAYNIVAISDSDNKELWRIIHGPDALFYTIDQDTWMLYGSNIADASISIFDLNKLEETNYCDGNSCWVKDIELWTGIDEVIVDSEENIYVRNRVWGSTVYKYSQKDGKLFTFDNENNLSEGKAIWDDNNWDGWWIDIWPSGFALNEEKKELYVMGHYNLAVDIVDSDTGEIKDKVYVDKSLQARTDAVSTMAYNKKENVIYGFWAEFGFVGVFDLNKGTASKIDLYQYWFNSKRETLGAFGHASLGVSEETNTLYLYLREEGKLMSFDGTTLEKELEKEVWSVDRMDPNLLFVNDKKKEVYLQNYILDFSLEEKSSFDNDSRIVGFNWDDLYVVEYSVDWEHQIGTLYKYSDGKYTEKWELPAYLKFPNNYYFDFEHNKFYVGVFSKWIVEIYDVDGGTVINETFESHNSEESNSVEWKCGDNVCDEFETKNLDICPQDCKILNDSDKGEDRDTEWECWDNVCDEYETQNPNVCPKDCGTGLGSCGDGVCDENETQNAWLCPQDCEKSTKTGSIKSLSNSDQEKCGDNLCDENETKNPGLCPQDCKGEEGSNAKNIEWKCWDQICDDIEKKTGSCIQDCATDSF